MAATGPVYATLREYISIPDWTPQVCCPLSVALSDCAPGRVVNRGNSVSDGAFLCSNVCVCSLIQHRMETCYYAAKAVKRLNDRKVIHADWKVDLKLDYFRVSFKSDGRRKIKLAEHDPSKVTKAADSTPIQLQYADPKVLLAQNVYVDLDPFAPPPKVTLSSDVFSLSMALVELMTGAAIYAGEKFDVAAAQMVNEVGKRPALPRPAEPRFPKAWLDLVQEMWELDPDARPPIADVCKRLKAMRKKMDATGWDSDVDSDDPDSAKKKKPTVASPPPSLPAATTSAKLAAAMKQIVTKSTGQSPSPAQTATSPLQQKLQAAAKTGIAIMAARRASSQSPPPARATVSAPVSNSPAKITSPAAVRPATFNSPKMSWPPTNDLNAARDARKKAEEEADHLRNQIALLQRKKEKEEKRIEEEKRKAKEVVEILNMHHENFGQKHEVTNDCAWPAIVESKRTNMRSDCVLLPVGVSGMAVSLPSPTSRHRSSSRNHHIRCLRCCY
jgi:hypothetical protein